MDQKNIDHIFHKNLLLLDSICGLCIFLSTEEGLTLQEDSYLVNATSLDLSNIAIASHELLDINVDSNGDDLILGKGGTTDLHFYILAI